MNLLLVGIGCGLSLGLIFAKNLIMFLEFPPRDGKYDKYPDVEVWILVPLAFAFLPHPFWGDIPSDLLNPLAGTCGVVGFIGRLVWYATTSLEQEEKTD